VHGLRVICKNVTVTLGADRLKQQRKKQDFTRCKRRRHGNYSDIVGCALDLCSLGYFLASLLANVTSTGAFWAFILLAWRYDNSDRRSVYVGLKGRIDCLLVIMYSAKLSAKIINLYIYIWHSARRFLTSWNKYRNIQ